MMISESDRRTWPFIIIFFLFITVLFLMLKISIPISIYNQISTVFYSIDSVLGVTAGLNLVMIGGSYGVRRLIEVMTQKRLTHK